VGLERSALSHVNTTEELLGRKSSGSCLEIRDYGRRGSFTLNSWHPLSARVGANFADKRLSHGWFSLLADLGHGVCFYTVPISRYQLLQDIASKCRITVNWKASEGNISWTSLRKI
jgi:hypothetical protein